MKKTRLQFSLLALMLWAASSAFAASCQEDFNSIAKAIQHDHGILTTNGVNVYSVSGHPWVRDHGSCGAYGKTRIRLGMHFKFYNVNVFWKMGKWEPTVVAHLRHG
ncbi:hypothetical protein [Candidatus Sororendozoicomonas aggregata]|uniref:hypothetical protein n=1 Tax=Candidatus Sororendozoicomonas aggregata TaxID=3073239 RepID=UPI002ECFC469